MKPIVLLLLLIISVYAWQQEAEFTLAKCVSCIPSDHTGCTATTDCCTGLGLSCNGGVCTT